MTINRKKKVRCNCKRKSFLAAEKSAAEQRSKLNNEHGLKFRLHFLEELRGGGGRGRKGEQSS
jgi:hypothetical protein